MIDEKFRAQVELLLQVLPHIAKEKEFALKGGTAINLFIWDMPRFSVDIDLTFLPILSRDETLDQISQAVSRLKTEIEKSIAGSRVVAQQVAGVSAPTSFTVETKRTLIKVEINFVLRGSVFPPSVARLCQTAQNSFEKYVEINTLHRADLYGGKLCAALDRQHPRDLFDVMILFQNQGITDEIRRAFIVYLASHARPMNELLAPSYKNIREVYENEFVGMTNLAVTLKELEDTREKMVSIIRGTMTDKEKQFLLSLKEGQPLWSLMDIPHLETLPGIKWKLINIRKMTPVKRAEALTKLARVLS